MEYIVVIDTNTIINLHAVGLLDELFHLPLKVHTTDLVMSELQREDPWKEVLRFKEEGTLHVAQFEFDEIVEISKLQSLSSETTIVSLADYSVWYYAKKNSCIMFAGDHQFLPSAMCVGVDIKGILYVFDLLVVSGVVSMGTAAEKLTLLKLINPSLPKDEVEKRLLKWHGEQNKKGGRL